MEGWRGTAARPARRCGAYACGPGLAPVPMLLPYICRSVTLVGLDDRTLGHAMSVDTLCHNVSLTKDSQVARAVRSASPLFGNQRPNGNACMRVLVDLQSPPKGPPLPLSYTVLHALRSMIHATSPLSEVKAQSGSVQFIIK